MDIKLIGKSTGTVGMSIIKVRGKSGKKHAFSKEPGFGYISRGNSAEDVKDIFETQNHKFAYYFMPLLNKEVSTEALESFEYDVKNMDLDELKELCKKLGLEILPQDKERSMRRLIEAFQLGVKS